MQSSVSHGTSDILKFWATQRDMPIFWGTMCNQGPEGHFEILGDTEGHLHLTRDTEQSKVSLRSRDTFKFWGTPRETYNF